MNTNYVIMAISILCVLLVHYPIISTLALIGGLYCFLQFVYGIIATERAKAQAQAVSSSIEQIEAAIVAQLQTISYLDPNAGGTVRGVTDIKTFLDLTALGAPSATVVFDGEKAMKNETLGKVTQQTTWFWTLYLGAASFGTDGEGRLGDVGSYQMIDDVVGALEGFVLTLPPDSNTTKMTYIGSARYHVGDTVVIYEARFQHQFLRQGP